MKQVFTLIVVLLASITSFSQVQKTTGSSGMPTVVDASDKSRPDFLPGLIHLDQHPIPSAEYGTKKEELNILRAKFEAEQAGESLQMKAKTRATAINPIEVKGIQGNIANSIPNDNDIAVSNAGKVVSVVNSNMRVYDDTGAVLSNISLTNLFLPLDTFAWISDPRVLYDPNADRFILVCFSGSLSTTSTILVAFTQSNDPSGSWNLYSLNGNSFNDSTWSDYPIIAISDKDLFMTFNQVMDNVSWTIGFKQSVIWQIDKQLGYAGNPLQYTLWSNIKYENTNLRNICPAKYQSTTMGDNMYFLTLRNVAPTNDSIFITEITNSHASGLATLQQRLLITPVPYGFPPNARMKHPVNGNKQYLMTNDARVLAAVYENDYIHFGSNTINTQYMNAGVYLGTIKNISGTTPVVSADILSTSTMEYGYPSMTYVGGGGNDHRVLYTFSHCVTDSFPGTSIVYKDASENYSDILRLKNGTTYINQLADTNERWGDYTNIQKMYNNPNRCYLSGSWGKTNAMNCWISVVDIPEWPTQVSDVENVSQSTVYPNPVTQNRFTAQVTMTKSARVRFTLYDMQGKKVAHVMYPYLKEGRSEFSISTDELPKGMYVLKLTTDEGELASHKISVN
jgi:hypothetical protein